MARQVTGTTEPTLVNKTKLTVLVWIHQSGVEINQVAVIHTIALRYADSVCVMADTTRRSLVANVLVVIWEAFIGEDAVTAVTVVT